jgi:hypothetical protein
VRAVLRDIEQLTEDAEAQLGGAELDAVAVDEACPALALAVDDTSLPEPRPMTINGL